MQIRSQRWWLWLVLLGSTQVLTSCGGDTLGDIIGQGSFTGTWSGSVGTTSLDENMTLVIDSNNNVSGNDYLTQPGTQAVDSGTISINGNLNMQSSVNGHVVGTYQANLTEIASTLIGSGTLVVNGVSTTISINLTNTSDAAKLKK